MNDTNATMTGTVGATEGRSPKPEARSNAEGASPEIRIQQAGARAEGSENSYHAPRSTLRTTRSHRLLLTLLGAVLTTATAWSAYLWWNHARTWVSTDNAFVAAHIHQISSRVAGTVTEVLVEENQLVEAGKLIARLDVRDFEVKRQQGLAQVAQAQAQVQQANAQIAQARAQVAREQAQATKAKQDFERAKALFQGTAEAISRQEFDAAQAGADAAQAALRAVEAAVESTGALAVAAQAQVKVAQANLKEAELQLSYTEILAPTAGRIGKKNLETGNRVQPGQALLALVQPDVWVAANFKETQLAHLKPGQPVRLRVDAFPGRVFAGRVESLAPASGAQFALLPPDNATGNFTRIVQRVPVKIVFDSQSTGDCRDRIVPGMSAVVEIKIRE
ncbi:MAG: HlyD family secretion protein [Verrucomicrobia bacterium]|nr:HlyD family secretion protein [Verrucomicrobiota bacterium]